jgi:hypothetical protein
MTWHRFLVEVHTNDGRDNAGERIEREVRRALDSRFGAVVVERDRQPVQRTNVPHYPPGSMEHAP